MCAIRTLGSFLEDLLRFGIDPVADSAVQGIARYQVDLAAEQLAEPVLQTEKPNQANASVRIEFDQEIDIAGGFGLAARGRAEHGQGPHAFGFQVFSVVDQPLADIFESHGAKPHVRLGRNGTHYRGHRRDNASRTLAPRAVSR